MSKYLQGLFKPKNPSKYAGNPKGIVYRSSWELKFQNWCDSNPNVVRWASEEFAIFYHDPTTNRLRRYFPDFIVEIMHKEKKKIIVVEIKPLSQTQMPKPSKNKKKMITEAMTLAVNQAKWESAKRWCDQRGYEFRVLTEQNLGIPSG